MTFYQGDMMKQFRGNLFVATLRSESLIRVVLDSSGDRVKGIERWFAHGPREGRFGRIRDVVEGHDGALYFLTNNTDGRGTPIPGDDKIYRIVPKR
jgi:quinoprotein glucose dehydrogenase